MNRLDLFYIQVKRSASHVGLIIYGMMLLLFIITQGCGDPVMSNPIKETGTVTDIEGNTYMTIKIGNQWWMAENLRVTSFKSGEKIRNIEAKEEWLQTQQPAFTIYNNSFSGPGLLYNFHVIDHVQEIAPEGWRVPSDEDWMMLEEFIGIPVASLDKTNWRGTIEGDQLKEESTITSGWIYYDGVWGNNTTGFSASGGSCRVFNGEWGVPGLRHSGFWWSSTPNNGYGWYRYLDYKKSGIFRYSAHPNYGFSIRCIRN